MPKRTKPAFVAREVSVVVSQINSTCNVFFFVDTSMGRSKRSFLATAEETSSPPASLPTGHIIAQIIKAEGTYLYSVHIPSHSEPLLVELPSRFRSQIWIKRGGYVVVNTSAFDNRDNKLDGEIENIVRNEREWRKYPYWLEPFLSNCHACC